MIIGDCVVPSLPGFESLQVGTPNVKIVGDFEVQKLEGIIWVFA